MDTMYAVVRCSWWRETNLAKLLTLGAIENDSKKNLVCCGIQGLMPHSMSGSLTELLFEVPVQWWRSLDGDGLREQTSASI